MNPLAAGFDVQELDNTVGSEVVPKLAHPESLARNIDELMEVATNNNDMMHGVVRGIVEAMNGLYEQGPLKKKERVMEKAEGDYEVSWGWRCGVCVECVRR